MYRHTVHAVVRVRCESRSNRRVESNGLVGPHDAVDEALGRLNVGRGVEGLGLRVWWIMSIGHPALERGVPGRFGFKDPRDQVQGDVTVLSMFEGLGTQETKCEGM